MWSDAVFTVKCQIFRSLIILFCQFNGKEIDVADLSLSAVIQQLVLPWISLKSVWEEDLSWEMGSINKAGKRFLKKWIIWEGWLLIPATLLLFLLSETEDVCFFSWTVLTIKLEVLPDSRSSCAVPSIHFSLCLLSFTRWPQRPVKKGCSCLLSCPDIKDLSSLVCCF